MSNRAQDVAEILVRCQAVTFSTDPFYTYTSGLQSPIYTDNRKLIGYVKERNIVVDALVASAEESFAGKSFGAVAGTATAGIPWAAWVAERMSLPMLYVRSEAKGHGKGKATEGFAPEGTNVLLVEDLFTTGGSAKTSIENMRNDGFSCDSCLGIFTYGRPQVAERFEELGVAWTAITNVDETLAQAKSQSLLDDEQVGIVEGWLREQRSN